MKVPSPFMLPLLSAGREPDFRVAFATVHGSILPGLKRYLRVYATFGADRGIHFPSPLIAVAIAVALLLPGRSTFITTLGLIGIAPGREQRLLVCAKSETGAAILALEGLFNVLHGQPPFLDNLVEAWSSVA